MADPWTQNPEDYYELLVLDRGAPNFEAACKSAFNRISQLYHPDMHPGATEEQKQHYSREFQRRKVAYDILSDASARNRYDAWLDAGGLQRARSSSSHQRSQTNTDSGTQSNRRERHQESAGQQRTQEESRQDTESAPPQPRFVIRTEPDPLEFAEVKVGQRYLAKVFIANFGAPLNPNLFRVLAPDAPQHPEYSPSHWLRFQSKFSIGDSETPIGGEAYSFIINTTSLKRGQQYQATIIIEYDGVQKAIPVRVSTSTEIIPLPRLTPKNLALAAAALLFALFLFSRLVNNGSGSGRSNHQQSQIAVVQSIATPAAPTPPPSTPIPTTGLLTINASTPDGAIVGKTFTVSTKLTDVVGKTVAGDRIGDITTSKTGTGTLTLKPGHYVLTTDGPPWGDLQKQPGLSDLSVQAGQTTTINYAQGRLDIAILTYKGEPETVGTVGVSTQGTRADGTPFADAVITGAYGGKTGLATLYLPEGTYVIGGGAAAMYNVKVVGGQVNRVTFQEKP